MNSKHQQITIVTLRKPLSKSLNEELKWLGNSLGLFSERDKDSSMFRTFIELVKSAKRQTPISSEEISVNLGLTRGAVIHHLNKLTSAGVAVHKGRKYLLRDNNLTRLVEEIKKDINRSLEDIMAVTREIDRQMEL
ncbi:MAG: hypothetical protein QXT19_04060 [Candidatus Woesearchaeota archaeon]